MRDVNRIKPFCNTLATEWSKVPDWRLGQLIENLKRAYNINDLFYMEDDEFIEKLKA